MKLEIRGIHCSETVSPTTSALPQHSLIPPVGGSETVVSGLSEQQEHASRDLSNFRERICVAKGEQNIQKDKLKVLEVKSYSI